LDWKCYVGICTDGPAAIKAVYSGVVARIKDVAPYCKATHCIFHREMLGKKKISVELNSVLNEVVKIMNFLKVSGLNSLLFSLICEDMGSSHQRLLQHTEVSWLSRRKVLSRALEIRHEFLLLLGDKKHDWVKLFKDKDWVAKLVYLSDIFSILNDLNTSLQGQMASVFRMADKIEGFKR
jgi:hypothetical protein